MAHRRTKRNRSRNRSRRTRGAGYGFQLSGSLPGIAEVARYTGPGKDCPEMPTVSSQPSGLPGLVGGSRRNKRRSRRQGGTYGFTQASAGQLGALPFQHLGCRGMRGGANPAYFAATAGYSTQAEVVPGSAAGGFLRTVAYPDKAFTPACMTGGSRRNRHRNRSRRSRRNH